MSRAGRSRGPEIEDIEKHILRYFVRNPRAADSLEGITRWRLLQERIDYSFEQTRKALQWLVSQGYVLEETSPVSGPIFRLNPAKWEEIQALLNKQQELRREPADTKASRSGE